MTIAEMIRWTNYTLGQDTLTSATKYVSDAQILEWLKDALFLVCVTGKVWDTFKASGITLATGTESYTVPTSATLLSTETVGGTVAFSQVANSGGAAYFRSTVANLNSASITTGTKVRLASTLYSGDYYVYQRTNEITISNYYLTSVLGSENDRLPYINTITGTIAKLTYAATTVACGCLDIIDVRMTDTGESLTKCKPFQRGKIFSSGTAPIWYFDLSGRIWLVPCPTVAENGLTADVFFFARPTDTLVASGASSGMIDGSVTYPLPIPTQYHPLLPLWAAIRGKLTYRLYDEANGLMTTFASQLGIPIEDVKARLGV